MTKFRIIKIDDDNNVAVQEPEVDPESLLVGSLRDEIQTLKTTITSLIDGMERARIESEQQQMRAEQALVTITERCAALERELSEMNRHVANQQKTYSPKELSEYQEQMRRYQWEQQKQQSLQPGQQSDHDLDAYRYLTQLTEEQRKRSEQAQQVNPHGINRSSFKWWRNGP
jgi:hypothetical protein